MKDSILPWDLLAFVNSSPTSSTASMSDYAEEGSKDEQDSHLLYESGVDDEARGVPARDTKDEVYKSSLEGCANGDSTAGDRRQPKRGEELGVGNHRIVLGRSPGGGGRGSYSLLICCLPWPV